MKLKLITLLFVALVATMNVSAQEPAPQKPAEEQQAVTNEDQGRAFVITGTSQPLNTLRSINKSAITEPQQYSLFLGSEWATPDLRTREAELSNLLASITDPEMLNTLNSVGVKNVFGATLSQERLDAFSGDRNVSDLEIQNVLAGMLEDGRLAKPTAATVYVVYLDAKLNSTLGSMLSGKHYLAYHNVFTASGVKVHYVVVPFQQDLAACRIVAERAFLAAVLNPDGSAQ